MKELDWANLPFGYMKTDWRKTLPVCNLLAAAS